jgi:hypothetical protein
MVADFSERHDREIVRRNWSREAFEQSPSSGRVRGLRRLEHGLRAIHQDDERHDDRDANDHDHNRLTHLPF